MWIVSLFQVLTGSIYDETPQDILRHCGLLQWKHTDSSKAYSKRRKPAMSTGEG